MIKKVIISFLIILITYIGLKYMKGAIGSSKTSYLYTEEEQKELWKEVEVGNRESINKLILYYRLHDFQNNIITVAKLRKKSLDETDAYSCFVYGEFMVQHFDKNSKEYKEGMRWLSKAKNMGSKEASSLLLETLESGVANHK
jgi:hypothetical protein